MAAVRPMSSPEREYLDGLLRAAPTRAKRWRTGAANALVLLAASLLLFAAAWWVAAWLARSLLGWEIGLRSPAGFWIAAAGVLASTLGAFTSTARWLRGWRDPRPALQADLEEGRVLDELYRFTEAKRFQEPEHGGLFYCLRTADDRVLVLYDAESQDREAQGEDPLGSTFKPCAELRMVRAPKTGYVISRQFSGAPLDAGEPFELTLPPKRWPESDAYCDIPWHELEKGLSRGRRASTKRTG